MKVRKIFFIGTASLAVVLAVLVHILAGDRTMQMEEARKQAGRQMRSGLQQEADLSARVEAAHERLRTLLAEPRGDMKQVDHNAKAPVAAPASAGPSRNARIANDPDLREMAVKAYVDDRKLMFAGLLNKMGLAPEQRQKFDAIQAEYEQGVLDLAAAAEQQHLAANAPAVALMRQQIDQVQDAGYQNLFGPAYDQWMRENSTLSARQLISQIAQRTFPGAGALNGSQTDQLTEILASSRTPNPSGPGNYDWNAVFRQTSEILNPQQLEGFKTGVELYLAQSQMSSITANSGGH